MSSVVLGGIAAVLAGVIAQDAQAVGAILAVVEKLSPPTLYALAAFSAVVVLFLVTLPKGSQSAPSAAASCPATAWPAGKPALTDPATYPRYDLSDPKGSFHRVNAMLIDEMCGELGSGYELPGAEAEWVRKMLEYNVCGGKMNRGLMVVECGREIFKASGKPLTNEMLVKFAVLGWIVEWLQAWLLVADDFMDDSQTRRGQPCWYLQPHVQKIALNDAFMIEMLLFKVLKRHFSQEACYVQLLDLLLETTFQTECGQLLDTLCMNLGLADFTLQRWTLIVKYKTAFYSFYLPVAMGMIVAGVSERAEYDAAREILMIMGIYFQVGLAAGGRARARRRCAHAPCLACRGPRSPLALPRLPAPPSAGAGRLPRLLWHARADRQGGHGHPGQEVRLALRQRVPPGPVHACAEGAARRHVRQVQGGLGRGGGHQGALPADQAARALRGVREGVVRQDPAPQGHHQEGAVVRLRDLPQEDLQALQMSATRVHYIARAAVARASRALPIAAGCDGTAPCTEY